MEPADRQVHRRQVFPERSLAKPSANRICCDVRTCQSQSQAPRDRHRLPLRRSKGFRPDRPHCRPTRPRRNDHCRPGRRRQPTKKCFFGSTGSSPTRSPSKSPTTTHRPHDRSRRRHVPHALALRTLRPEPDLQPEIRHRPHRPRHRGTRRYHRSLGRPHRQRHWLQVHRYTGEALLLTISSARAYHATKPLASPHAQWHGQDFSWNASAANTANCTNAFWQIRCTAPTARSPSPATSSIPTWSLFRRRSSGLSERRENREAVSGRR